MTLARLPGAGRAPEVAFFARLAHAATPPRVITVRLGEYNPDQPRDELGRFGEGGGGAGGGREAAGGLPPADREHATERGQAVAERINEAAAGKFGDECRATDEQHDRIDGGKWTAEREAQHEQIIDDIMAAHAGVPNDAEAVIMGGLPGAGKSSIVGEGGLDIDPSQYIVINPDDMKQELVDRGMGPDVPGLKPLETASLLHEESSALAYKLGERAAGEGKNVVWDITMNSSGSVNKRLDDLQSGENGPTYHVTQVFVDVKPSTSADRATERYERAVGTPNGGRYIPREVIESSTDPTWGSKNRAAFEEVKGRADEWILFNNDGAGPVELERGGRQ